LKRCYCGSQLAFTACCEPILNGSKAETAEQLMRSRYSAFCLQDIDYLKHSWHPKTCPKDLGSGDWPHYKSLTIIKTQDGFSSDKVGKVTFEASYLENQKQAILRECSRFKRFEGRWVYFDGKIDATI
jgi:SEC-C motif domain protein